MNDSLSGPPPVCTVLVVEDNEIYRQVVCAALQRHFPNWEFLTAASLAEARALIDSKKFDVAVTDLSLPDGSGVELIASLASQLEAGLKLIALTNDSPSDVLSGLRQKGYHGFVAKEHGLRALCDALQAVIGGADFVSQGPSA